MSDYEIITDSVGGFLSRWSGRADFVHADPAWLYRNTGGRGAVEGRAGKLRSYETIPIASALDDLYTAAHHASDNCYLALWITCPLLFEFSLAYASYPTGFPWRYIVCGAWEKTGRLGTGYHWRGDLELCTLWRKGKPRPTRRTFRNLWSAPRRSHSEKPVEALYEIVRMACPREGLVLDLYAGGSGSMGRACLLAGRRYLGVEIDPERAAAARASLAGFG